MSFYAIHISIWTFKLNFSSFLLEGSKMLSYNISLTFQLLIFLGAFSTDQETH